ncbi:MAG: hypothetical protein COA78_16520 [Blastopirellula sp.]|nr:MAG: hypothetical protein COA78_16520 [Blastopirellula sp.]
MKCTSSIHPNTSTFSHPFQLGFKPLLVLWFRNYRTRKALNGMDGHRLHDIGVDRAQAEAENQKPFWR